MFHSATWLSISGQIALDVARDVDGSAHHLDLEDIFCNAWVKAQGLGQVGMRAAEEDRHRAGRIVYGFHDELRRRTGSFDTLPCGYLMPQKSSLACRQGAGKALFPSSGVERPTPTGISALPSPARSRWRCCANTSGWASPQETVIARTSKSGFFRKYSSAIMPSGLPSSSTMSGMGASSPNVGSGRGTLAAGASAESRTGHDLEVRPITLETNRFQTQPPPKRGGRPDQDDAEGQYSKDDPSDDQGSAFHFLVWVGRLFHFSPFIPTNNPYPKYSGRPLGVIPPRLAFFTNSR